jgi:two-component system, chemotaxis family, chemotaxis protein CheY
MRTLVIDDDQICRSVLQHALQAYGPVTYAVDGVGAVAEVARSLAEGRSYDLITLDIMMPDLDGKLTLKLIRRLEEMFTVTKPARIAMTTALDDKASILGSFRDQADLYFIKPLRLDRVLADLRKAGLITA